MDGEAGGGRMTIRDEYARILVESRGNVDRARRKLGDYAGELSLDLERVMEIRARIGALMADHKLSETELGHLVACIILVIGSENILKDVEEHNPDD